MKIHEYQAKQILSDYGIPIPPGQVANSPKEAGEIAAKLGGSVVVKAQIHVGGRGKAGGIRLADTPEQAGETAARILETTIKGLPVRKVLVERAIDIAEEFYLGITLDRARHRNVVMISRVGGVDIEEVASQTPERIAKVYIEPDMGLTDYQIRQGCLEAGLPRETMSGAARFLRALYQAYLAVDASLAEINPLVLTSEGKLVAADAKIVLDDNAVFRHPELQQYREESDEEPLEAEAHRRGLQFVKLDGDIGVIGNGAGLVMATMDEIKRAGGSPADFLDIGGGARADLVRTALEVVLMNPRVKGVLINVFGGITRCDEVARGLIEAISAMRIAVPMVVRLTGTNEAEGRALLAQANLSMPETAEAPSGGRPFALEATATMQEGAARIVALTR